MKDEADPEAVEMKRCFKDGFYRDCAPSPDVAPADCIITCPEELPQCEDGCADCLITSSSCKACATATCLKVKPLEPRLKTVPPSNEQPANAEQ